MSAPLFYAVAIAIGYAMRKARSPNDSGVITLRSCVILLAIVPMSLEGVTEFTTVNREESVAASQIVAASSDAVERALFEAPRFDRVRPFYLNAGFPSPVATRIEHNSEETHWVIQMRGGNAADWPGAALRRPHPQARRSAAWIGAVARHFRHQPHDAFPDVARNRGAVAGGRCEARQRVTWTLRCLRGLDPAWYFGPMERYAAQLAAGYLIDSVATP